MAKLHYDSLTLCGLHVMDRIYIFQNIRHIVVFDPRLKSNKMQCIAAVNVTKKLTKSSECKLAAFFPVFSIYSSSIHTVYAVT